LSCSGQLDDGATAMPGGDENLSRPKSTGQVAPPIERENRSGGKERRQDALSLVLQSDDRHQARRAGGRNGSSDEAYDYCEPNGEER